MNFLFGMRSHVRLGLRRVENLVNKKIFKNSKNVEATFHARKKCDNKCQLTGIYYVLVFLPCIQGLLGLGSLD